VVTADGADGAIKQMRASESARDCIPHTSVREVAALAALGGAPHIPNPISMEAHESGVVHVQMQRLACTLMEEQERRSALLRRRSAQEVRKVLEDVGAALHHAHAKGIAHRDIKLENIMMDKRRCFFLIDWGLCCFRERGSHQAPTHVGDRYTTDVGTPIYRSPDALGGVYDVFAADVWALAIVCVELFMGRHPYRAKDNGALMAQIRASFAKSDEFIARMANGPLFSVASALDKIEMRDAPLAATLRAMLRMEPEARPSMRAVVASLSPPDAQASAPASAQLPAPPLPPLGKARASASVLRAHAWIAELANTWSLSQRAHDVAQWCFASSLRKEPTENEISKRAATVVVLCSKAFCSNSRLTSSAQRVCTEQHAPVRESDRSINKEFRKMEAEMLCMMGGKFFFYGIAERTRERAVQLKKASRIVDASVFFTHVAVVRCGSLLAEPPAITIKRSIDLAEFVFSLGRFGLYTNDSDKIVSYAKIELETAGPIVQLTKFSLDREYVQFIQKMTARSDTVIVHVTENDESDAEGALEESPRIEDGVK
jgi:serine/threonine protein kinase